jgi:hypothetical protein
MALVSCVAVLTSAAPGAAVGEQTTSFYGYKESGWFWYEEPPPESAEQPVEPAAESVVGRSRQPCHVTRYQAA